MTGRRTAAREYLSAGGTLLARKVASLFVVTMLVLAGVSPGADAVEERQTTVKEISRQVMCPSCDSTLDQSDSPAADRMRAYVREKVAAGWTEQEVLDGLVAEYGGDQSILATPPPHGRGLAVWLVPVGVLVLLMGAGALTLRGWLGAGRRGRGGAAQAGAAGDARDAPTSR